MSTSTGAGLPPILLFHGARRRPQPPQAPPILNADGKDIRGAVQAAATAGGISAALVLACATAESGLSPRAERWGSQTGQARAAIAAGDWGALQRIVNWVWPDISFGYGQRIIQNHYLGDRSRSVQNIMAVRQHVFDHPDEDLLHLALLLADKVKAVQGHNLAPCGGDQLLAALVAYNAGHLPGPSEPYWAEFGANVANYRRGLATARVALSG